MLPSTKNDKPKELKVTDKRIFTPEGELREEFRNEIKPADPEAVKPAEAPKPVEKAPEKQADKPAEKPADRREAPRGDRRRSIAEKAPAQGTAFTEFLERLLAEAYMMLGMLPNPYGGKAQVDAVAARQIIDILSMLKEKTAGNLTPDEDEFLNMHLGDLKLAFVQRTKSI